MYLLRSFSPLESTKRKKEIFMKEKTHFVKDKKSEWEIYLLREHHNHLLKKAHGTETQQTSFGASARTLFPH